MKIVGIILAVLSFIGGQAYLFHCLRKLDQYLESRPLEGSAVLNDKRDSDSEDSVIE